MSGKFQENQRKNLEKKFKKTTTKKWKLKKKCVWGKRTKKNLKSVKSMKTKEKAWASRMWNKVIKEKKWWW